MASPLLFEKVWFDKYKYDDAEKKWQEHIAKNSSSSKNNDITKATKAVYTQLEDDNVNDAKLTPNLEGQLSERKLENIQDKPVVSCTELPNERKEKQVSQSTIVGEIVRARQHIKNSLQSGDNLTISLNSLGDTSELSNRVQRLEEENQELREKYQSLQSVVQKLESRVSLLEGKEGSSSKVNLSIPNKPQEQPKDDDDDEDDDLDLFGSEEEDEEAAKVREQRLKDYEAKKSKKKTVIAKSSIVLDVKPWDDETDMKQLELSVRNIKTDGLVWGASKLVPLAYGIFKLQIGCVVEDEKVSVDWLQETIQEIEDYVQSVDIAAFNKL